MLDTSPKMLGKELENEGAAWIAAKCILPILSLHNTWPQHYFNGVPQTCTYESLKPNVALA